MSFLKYVQSPHDRIVATHFLVIFILVINITYFTISPTSITIQIILIFAILLHNRDDIRLNNQLLQSQSQLIDDSKIFDRNIIISESDLDGNITYVNSNFCKISGYSQEELIGKKHSILKDPNADSSKFKKLWQTIKSGKTYNGVLKNIKKNGTPYWIDASISPIIKSGNIVGYKAIRFNITDQILLKDGLKHKLENKEKLLQEQMNRFEFAINSSRDGFWDYNLRSEEFYLSSGWKKRLGFHKDEKLTYLDYLSLMPDEHRYEHHHAMSDTLEEYPINLESVHFRIRYPLITKNGEKLLIEDVGDAFFSKNQEPIRITGFHRDITEQERQNKMIESQNRVSAMGEMVGNIAHQWRQPIGAINNVLNNLEFDIELEELSEIKSSDYLKVSNQVKEYTAHLSKTIDDFKSISSDEKVKSNFFIKDVINSAYNIISTQYEAHNINFIVSNAEKDNCEFTGYERELMQVLINILNNAKDVLINKNINTPKVIITLSQNNSNILITIHDNAGGVPEDIMEKIFDPYFTTKHESIGTGIGLYMSKKIINTHFKGSLSVENESDGAKFTITLPKS